MFQRIANLFSKKPKDAPCAHVITDGAMEVRVREYAKDCGHAGYALELCARHREEDRWVELGFIGAEDLQQAIMLLQEALAFVNGHAAMPRQLQTTWLWGATYFVDERLGELRQKDDPSDRVPIERN